MEKVGGTYSVYIHHFPNGKMYIGITCQKVENRWHNGAGYSRQPLINAAIQKYGWNNICHEIFASNLNKEEAENIETLLISKLQTNNREIGYNIESGGNTCTRSNDNQVNQIVRLWKEGNAISTVARMVGVCSRTATNCLKNNGITDEEIEEQRKILIGKSSLKYDENEVLEMFQDGKTQKEIREILGCSDYYIICVLNKYGVSKRERQLRTAQPVEQYTLSGEYIRTFESSSDAMEAVSGSRRGGHIVDVCKGRRRSAYGYIWRYPLE